jgi:hypothetical protein
MKVKRDWLDVRLDQGSRRTAAEALEIFARQLDDEGGTSFMRLARMLRVGRDEFLLDNDQAHDLLTAIEESGQLTTLRPRLEAFLREG